MEVINDRDDLSPYRKSKQVTLSDRLIQFSPGTATFDWAINQWELIAVHEDGLPCLCTHGENGEAIKYLTYVRNIETGDVARIGSSCIQRFAKGTELEKSVTGYLSIYKNRSVTKRVLDMALAENIITPLDYIVCSEARFKNITHREFAIVCSAKAKIAIARAPLSPESFEEEIHQQQHYWECGTRVFLDQDNFDSDKAIELYESLYNGIYERSLPTRKVAWAHKALRNYFWAVDRDKYEVDEEYKYPKGIYYARVTPGESKLPAVRAMITCAINKKKDWYIQNMRDPEKRTASLFKVDREWKPSIIAAYSQTCLGYDLENLPTVMGLVDVPGEILDIINGGQSDA